MSFSVSEVSPVEVDAGGGAKLTILGDFSEHLGEDFEVELVSIATAERYKALTGRPGTPRTIQPLNGEKMVCFAPQLEVAGDSAVLLSDNFDSDAGYWEAGQLFGSPIFTFAGGFVTLRGFAAPLAGVSQAWSGYRVTVEVRGTSAYPGVSGGFGVSAHTGVGLGNLAVLFLNTIDNAVWSNIVINGVATEQSYALVVNDGQWYEITLEVRILTESLFEVKGYVDSALIFSTQHSGTLPPGPPMLWSVAQESDFDNLVVTSLSGQKSPRSYVRTYDLVVRRVASSVEDTLSNVIQSLPKQYNTSVFSYRSLLPPTYKTGPRNLGLLERI